ncbi:autotransporter outer membrane beta-barrel domain-containing protein [Paracoccus siganidrum]|uniref:Autotransporter domain-containing protein n=1 Tax=Paracoccus siganidrum TaxID=1276757 RepID=A0A419ABJ4_9RHOB|nr:autotransporter domain-containing protein [Paracoccus siganidrum]RJL20900.1 autotransporter domain-containing protein [Paracoccus siganidrum]RMC25986.1 hypothetical protein C9E82_22900 [Paracoccus siganidrum]
MVVCNVFGNRKFLLRQLGGSTAGLALLVGLGLASSPALADPRSIPLDYLYVKDDKGNDELSRITIWVSTNDGQRRQMLFDTGSDSANMQLGSDVSGVKPTPDTEPRGYFYGDGTYGYLLQQVDVDDIAYHATDGSEHFTLPVEEQSTYQVARIVDVIYTADYKGPEKPLLSADPVYVVTNEDGSKTAYYADLNARKQMSQDKPIDDNGTLWGTFGAGNYLRKEWASTSGLIGRATKTGYVIAANGNSVSGKQDLTPGCSPCLIVDVNSAVRAQFTSVMPWGDKSAVDAKDNLPNFPGSGAPASAEFEGNYTLAFGDDDGAPSITKVATLLDTGTPGGGQITISTARLNALVASGVKVDIDKDGNKTIPSLNLVAGDGMPVGLSNIDVVEIEGNADTPVQFIAGMDFFVSQSVMYDLENQSTAYTPYFVSANNFTTDTPAVDEIGLSRVTAQMGSPFPMKDDDGTEYTVGYFGAAGVISGAGDLTVAKHAQLRLSNANTYTGQTVIEADGTLELAGIGSIETSSRVVADGTLDIGDKGNRIALWGVSDAYNDARIRSLSGSGTVLLYDRNLVLTAAQDSFSGTIIDLDAEKKHHGGGLIVQGGVQTLAGNNQYTGATTINTGAGLILTSKGSLASKALVSGGFANDGTVNDHTTVQNGGTAGGTGTFHGLTVTDGGAVATGGVAPLKVEGSFTQQAGSTLVFGPVAGGAQPGIAVSGQALIENGASVTLDRATAGRLSLGREYLLLGATGSVSGGYDTLAGDLVTNAPFLSFALNNTPANVVLEVERSDIAFADVAQSANQASSAFGLESLGSGNPLYDEALYLSASEAASAFDSVSGEIHASMQGALIDESHFLRDAVNGRLRAAFGTVGASKSRVMALTASGAVDAVATIDGPAYWGHAFGARGRTDGDGNAAQLDRRTHGLVLGYDALVEDWRMGGVLAMSDSSYDVDDRVSLGSGKGIHLGAYAGTEWGQTALRAGLTYSTYRLKADRHAAIGEMAAQLSSKYDGHVWQAFAEVGHRVDHGNMALEPYAGLAHVRLRTDSFAERGGSMALGGAEGVMNTTFTTIGLRAATTIRSAEHDLAVSGGIGWRHAFGDVDPELAMAFAGGAAFDIAGAAIARNAAVLDLGADINLGERATMRLDYQGQLASDAREHRLAATFSMRF